MKPNRRRRWETPDAPVVSGEKQSRRAQLAGLGLAGVGLAHFVAPQLFERMIASVFGGDPRKRIYVNGCIETTLGAGVAIGRTRPIAIAGTIGYVAYLVGNFLRNRWHTHGCVRSRVPIRRVER